MNYLNIKTDSLKSEEFIGAEPIERATWIALLGWCASQENGGVIINCTDWSDRKWQQLCGVTKTEVETQSELFAFEDGNLIVAFYPADQESEVIRKREIAKANGKRGGRPKKPIPETKEKPTSETKTKPTLVSNPEPMAESVKEGKGMERKEKESREPKGSCRIASDAPPTLDPVWDAFPERGRRRSSRKKLTDAWRRIPAKDRPSVQTLLEAIAAWKATEDWRKQDGEFVPALDRWMRDRKWADPPELTPATTDDGELQRLLGGRKANITKASDLVDNENLKLESTDEPAH